MLNAHNVITASGTRGQFGLPTAIVGSEGGEIPEGACEMFGDCDPKGAACLECASLFKNAFEACLIATDRAKLVKTSAAEKKTVKAAAAKTGSERTAREGTLTQVIDKMLERGGSIGNMLTVLLDEQARRGGARYKNFSGIMHHVRARVKQGKCIMVGNEVLCEDFDYKKIAAGCTAATYLKLISREEAGQRKAS